MADNINIQITAGGVCALKTAWTSVQAVVHKKAPWIDAEHHYLSLAAEVPELLQDNFLQENYEHIWIDCAVQTCARLAKRAAAQEILYVDGMSIFDEPYAFNFTKVDGIIRFIEIMKDAQKVEGLPPLSFTVNWLALPIQVRQLLNQHREYPYNSTKIRVAPFFTATLPDDVVLNRLGSDEVFNAFAIFNKKENDKNDDK